VAGCDGTPVTAVTRPPRDGPTRRYRNPRNNAGSTEAIIAGFGCAADCGACVDVDADADADAEADVDIEADVDVDAGRASTGVVVRFCAPWVSVLTGAAMAAVAIVRTNIVRIVVRCMPDPRSSRGF
jgi:hypothetical protein